MPSSSSANEKTVSPSLSEKPSPHTVPPPQLFRFATNSDKLLMVIGVFFAMVGGSAFPFTTVVFGQLIDTFGEWETRMLVPEPQRITESQFMDKIVVATLFFIYLGIGTFVATYIYMGIFISSGERTTYRIRKAYLKAVLKQNISWFDSEGAGEVATRISSDTLNIQDGISDKVPLFLSQVCTTIAGFAIALWKSWKLTLVIMCVIPIVGLTGFMMSRSTAKLQTKMLNLYATAGNIAEESISFVRTVQAFNAQKRLGKLYETFLVPARKMGIKKSAATGFGLGFLFFIIYLSYSLAFWYGAKLLDAGNLTPGDVTNVFFAVLIGASSLSQVAPDLQAFDLAKGAAAKIYYTIDRKPEIDSSNTAGLKIEKSKLVGKIELKNISFHYPSRPDVPILENFSLIIPSGKSVALVGSSGSGKSTIIQLLERFYDPLNGLIELDGTPIKDFNIKWYRQQIGLVSQEPTLFEGSIKSNIMHGLMETTYSNLSDDEKFKMVKVAAISANAHDFIMLLPQQYDTPVGERGILLSGGQKQRIAIARAMVKNPSILLLDEATSALDSNSEKVVQEALEKASIGRTTVTIAHRLSTVKKCDSIVVMSRGKIIEQGSHKSLLQNPDSAYKKLVEAQHLHANDGEEAVSASAVTPVSDKEKDVGDSHHALVGDIENGIIAKRSTFKIFAEILKLNKAEIKYLIPAFISALAAGMIYPFFAIVFATIIGVFNARGADLIEKSNYWALMFVVIAIVNLVSNFFMNFLFGFAAEFLIERIRGLAFNNILNKDIEYFDLPHHGTGMLTSSLSSDASKIQGISGITLGSILTILTNLVGGIIVALVTGWKLALVAIACLPFLLINGYFRVKIITLFSQKAQEAYETSSQKACEAVSGIKTIQSLTREDDVLNQYLTILRVPLMDGLKAAWIQTAVYALSSAINFLVNALVFYYGGKLIATEGYSTQQMFTVFIAIVFGSMGAARMFAYAPDFSKAKDAGANILDIIQTPNRINVDRKDVEHMPKEIVGEIEFKDVKFSYPTRPHLSVLRGLDIKVTKGKYVALVGPSGCGKSTTIGLLERFYDLKSGMITLDGKDISKLDITEYRSNIGLVSQEPNLFDMTIEENICIGCNVHPPEQDIIRAAQEANIHDFIISLPEGYKTKVGSKGGQLSGGQKQRIAIARALIRNPKILLLDEASSALDGESEKIVQQALDKACKNRTTIAIAHRLSTIQHADTIYVIKDGKVFEAGTHQELLKKQGLYKELVAQQDL